MRRNMVLPDFTANNTMHTNGLSIVFLLLSLPLLLSMVPKFFRQRKKRFPDAPWLRLSPDVGRTGEIDDAGAFVKNGHEVIVAGYKKVRIYRGFRSKNVALMDFQYTKKGMNFLMRTPEGGQFVYHPKYIEEVRSAKEIDLHNLPANNDLMQTRHTMHKNLEWDQYHFNVVSKQLTHCLGEHHFTRTGLGKGIANGV